METIGQRARKFGRLSQSKSNYRYDKRSVEFDYTKGAKDQQAIDKEIMLQKSTITGKQYNRERAFATWYYHNGKGTPTYSDAIEWARKQTIEDAKSAFNKACGWLSTYTWYNEVVEEFIKNIEE